MCETTKTNYTCYQDWEKDSVGLGWVCHDEFVQDYPDGATPSEFECLNWEPGGGLGEDERFVVQSDLDVKLVDGEFILKKLKKNEYLCRAKRNLDWTS